MPFETILTLLQSPQHFFDVEGSELLMFSIGWRESQAWKPLRMEVMQKVCDLVPKKTQHRVICHIMRRAALEQQRILQASESVPVFPAANQCVCQHARLLSPPPDI